MQARPIDDLTADAVVRELHAIATWWLTHSIDDRHGGFAGEIDRTGKAVDGAAKGLVLNSRILWFFSELSRFDDRPGYRAAADRAYAVLRDSFTDPQYGGAFWAVDAAGNAVDDRKQTYALCFCVYAFSAYYALTRIPEARALAREFFDVIEAHAPDRSRGGYLEAFARDWHAIGDMRLGEDDLNAPKSMNTHLHLLEAYAYLHRVAPDARSENALRNAIGLFRERIIDPETGHLRLFFDLDWNELSRRSSIGHDIEASWLVWEAATVLGDAVELARLREPVLSLARTCLRTGMGKLGQVCDGRETATGNRSDDSVWWVQAEALVGFLNAQRLSGEPEFETAARAVWEHIQRRHIDAAAGEWHWMVRADGKPDPGFYKAGFWKGPYHNGRAMMEAARLLSGPGN